MDRSSLFDDYVAENLKNKETLENSQFYLDAFQLRVEGSQSMIELKQEVSNFLAFNTIPGEVSAQLLKICDSYDEHGNYLQAMDEMETYLESLVDQNERDWEMSDSDVQEIRTNFVEEKTSQLRDAGVIVVGDSSELVEELQQQADLDQMEKNVDAVLEDRASLEETDQTSVEVSIDALQETLEQAGDETLLEAVIEEENHEVDAETLDTELHVSDDGYLYLEGDKESDVSLNFAMMMATALMTSQGSLVMVEEMGMKLLKNPNHETSFKVEFGRFPLSNHPERKLDPETIQEISQYATQFQPSVDYNLVLGQFSPELQMVFQIFQNHILGQQGMAQVAVRNHNGDLDFLWGLDPSLQVVADSFQTNGAVVAQNIHHTNVVEIRNQMPGEELMILVNTNETLNTLRQEKENVSTLETSRGAYVKRYPSHPEAAQASIWIFILVILLEVTAVGMSLFLLYHS